MPPVRPNSQSKVPYILVVASWLLYGGLGLFAPRSATSVNYHLPPGVLNSIRITILLPILLFWFIAIYGAQTFSRYADLVSGSPEESPLRLLSVALYLTLVYFITGAIFGQLLHFYTTSPGYPGLVVLHGHLSAIITLIAFGFFYLGSSKLLNTASIKTLTRNIWIVAGAATVIAAGFALRFLTMPVSSSAIATSSLAYVPRWILLITMFLPYFVSWALGTLAVINIYRYARRVQGVLYREALRDLARGLILVICFSALGGVLVLIGNTIATLSIGPILLILYFALLLYGAGYALIATGARKLSRIEIISLKTAPFRTGRSPKQA
jgi:hypothetical protein